MDTVKDRHAFTISGFIMILILLAAGAIVLVLSPVLAGPVGIMAVVSFSGFTVVQPNDAKVLTFFGRYIGTVKQSGFLFTLPLTLKQKVPLKLINFNTDHLKVNDKNGNPIEIGAVIVWRVADAAQATFNVDHYAAFVANQSDSAVRAIAAHYPYDSETETSLRGNIDEIADKLQDFLQTKLSIAGIVIEEARLTHLAYAQEIAAAMLKRQQAVAIFQARQYLVQNALAIIDDVIQHFEKKDNIAISNDKKADLINNLLVTMTSDKESTPVINLGR